MSIPQQRRPRTPAVRTWVSQYTTNAARGAYTAPWNITVDLCTQPGRAELWAVRHLGYCLGRDGEWDYEPAPTLRTREWLRQYRHTLDEALRLAKVAAPTVTVGGRPAQEATR